MVALKVYEDTMVCPLCGGPKSECLSPENETTYRVDPPTRCHKTTAILRYMDGDWNDRPHNRALLVGAHK